MVFALFLMLSIVITARNSLGLMMPFWKEDWAGHISSLRQRAH